MTVFSWVASALFLAATVWAYLHMRRLVDLTWGERLIGRRRQRRMSFRALRSVAVWQLSVALVMIAIGAGQWYALIACAGLLYFAGVVQRDGLSSL